MFEPEEIESTERPRAEEQLRARVRREEATPEARYRARVTAFARDGEPHPKLRHAAFWAVHNLVAHPILAALPTRPAVELHELTSRWLNKNDVPGAYAKIRATEAKLPKIGSRAMWVVHNLVAHTAIGLAPCKATFAFHDWSAKAMKTPGWV